MEKRIFVKSDIISENEIYFEGRLIDGYTDMLNIILDNKNINFGFIGFSKDEMKLFRSIIKAYNSRNKDYIKNNLTIITHSLKYRDTKYYYLDSISLGNKILKDFSSIDKIDLKKIQNRYIVVVEGLVHLYGVKNNLGFYDVESDSFTYNRELEHSKKIVIEELRNHDSLHCIRKRIR